MSHHDEIAQILGDIWTPADSGNTEAWYSAKKETAYSDNDPANTITDFSGNGLDLDGTGHAPVFKTNIVNGKPVFRLSGAEYGIAAAAADWKFLSDGTNFYLAMVFYITNADQDGLFTVLDTGGNSSTTTGLAIHYDDRSGASRNDAILNVITNGVTNKVLINLLTPNDSFPAQTWGSLAADFIYPRTGNDMVARVDGAALATAETANPPYDTGAPDYPLNIGRDTVGSSFAAIDLAEIVIMKTPTEKEKTNLESYLSAEYAL